MKGGLFDGGGDGVSRRSVLKGAGVVGALGAVGAYQSGMVSALLSSNAPIALPGTVTREYIYYEDGSDGYAGGPMSLTRGLKQTNIAVVDEERAFAPQCGNKYGIRHDFTAAGFVRNGGRMGLSVNIPGTPCGRASITPNYSWYGYLNGAIEGTDPCETPSPDELNAAISNRYESARASFSGPTDEAAFEAAAGLILFGAGMVVSAPVVLGAAGGVLLVDSFVDMMTAEAEVDVYDTDMEGIDFNLEDDGDHRFYWSQFSVLVPSGESTTVQVRQPTSDDGFLADTNTLEYSIDIPEISVGENVGNISDAQVPTIRHRSPPPIDWESTGSSTVRLEANRPEEHFGTPRWAVQTSDGGTDNHSGRVWDDREYTTPGEYPASYICDYGTGSGTDGADDRSGGDAPALKYMASTQITAGTPPFDTGGNPQHIVDDQGGGAECQ